MAGRPTRSDRIDVTRFTRVTATVRKQEGPGERSSGPFFHHSREIHSSSFPRKRESSYAASVQREFSPTVYILASKRNGTLYVGVTSDPLGRLYTHRSGTVRGFTQQYSVNMLVWFEQHATMESAITREKQIKKWERRWKLELIEAANPDWRDLAEDFGFESLK